MYLRQSFLSLLLITSWNLIPLTIQQAQMPLLIIHGGAGSITIEHAEAKKLGMIEAIRVGYKVLKETDDPIAAVEQAVRVLEDSAAFNAGHGSVVTKTGEIECDAIIVNGTDLSAGSVGAVRHIKNPISLAKLVKERSDYVFMVGYWAEMFALDNGVTLVPTSQLISTGKEAYMEIVHRVSSTKSKTKATPRNKGLKSSGYDVGTVGAVAINSKSQTAAATSTGGLSGKLEGRVGDTPVIGAGTLADDEIGGISCTGWGEAFLRYRVASKVAKFMEQGYNTTHAINTALRGMAARIPESDGGVIAISKNGDLGFGWNSKQMAWAYGRGDDIHYGVNRDEDDVVPLVPPGATTFKPNNSFHISANFMTLIMSILIYCLILKI